MVTMESFQIPVASGVSRRTTWKGWPKRVIAPYLKDSSHDSVTVPKYYRTREIQ